MSAWKSAEFMALRLRDVTSRFREAGRPTFKLQWMAGTVVRQIKRCLLQCRKKDSWCHGARRPSPRRDLSCESACLRVEPDRGRSTKSSAGQHRHWKSR